MKYLKKINSHPVTFIALVAVQAYGHHQSKKEKYRKSWVSFKNGPRTAAVCAVGSSKGALKERTSSVWKPGVLPYDVMVSFASKASQWMGSQGSVISHCYLGWHVLQNEPWPHCRGMEAEEKKRGEQKCRRESPERLRSMQTKPKATLVHGGFMFHKQGSLV